MKSSIYEILEHYIEERTNGNHLIEGQCRQWLSEQEKNSEEIDEILIEFEDEWTKEQLLENGKKKGHQLIMFGSIGFVGLSITTIILALNGVLLPFLILFVGASLFPILSGYSEIRYTKYRKERRAIKWKN